MARDRSGAADELSLDALGPVMDGTEWVWSGAGRATGHVGDMALSWRVCDGMLWPVFGDGRKAGRVVDGRRVGEGNRGVGFDRC